jgi:hypothetical protein
VEKLAKSPLALAQIFEPIRDDLEKVDREFDATSNLKSS